MSRIIRARGLILASCRVVRSCRGESDASDAFSPGLPAPDSVPRSAFARGAPSSSVGVAGGKETT
jgi:hypothetical protein